MIIRSILGTLLTIFLIITTSIVQAAPPPLPSSFYGTVRAADDNLLTESVVSASIDGVTYVRTTLISDEGEWLYALDVPGDEPGTEAVEGGKPGDTVVFFLDGERVSTAPWQSGTNTQLDLTIPATAVAQAGNSALLVAAAATTTLVVLFAVWRLWKRQQVKKDYVLEES